MATFNKDKVFGALLVGTYVNSILYALESVAVIQYRAASKRNRDSLLLQAIVYFTFVVDTICSAVVCWDVYSFTVTHWGEPDYLRVTNRMQFIPESISIALNGITAMIVQSFLIYRFWRMTRNHYITFVLILCGLATLGGSVATTVAQLKLTASGVMSKLMSCAMIWFITSAVTDVTIAAVLLWQLRQIKSAFKRTQSLIDRLMVSTISTGTVTSAVAMIILIFFLTERYTYLSTGTMFCLGRVYALTMLFNLNYRCSLRQELCETNNVHTFNITNGIQATIDHCVSSTTNDSVNSSNRSHDDRGSIAAQEKSHITLA